MEPKINNLLCPNKECKNIPEITYTYNNLNSIVVYKCHKHNHDNELKLELSKFLKISSHGIICAYCKKEIINNNNNNIFYCYQCKDFFDHICLYKHNYSNKHREAVSLNINNIYNNCLKHNNTFIFRCTNCNESLCGMCDLNFHNFAGHELKQLINISNSKNEYEKIISDFNKQKNYLNLIKEMNNNIIQNLENDIILKEKIIENYKNNKFNFQSIQNFLQLKIHNNEEYEKILNATINQYNGNKNNQNSDNNDLFFNQILSPLYYSMMINSNQKSNNELINIMKNRFENENQESNNNKILNNNINKGDINLDNSNKKKNINNIKQEQKIGIIDTENQNITFEKDIPNKEIRTIEIEKPINNIIEKEHPYKELRTIEIEKPINNMIILRSGNIALSEMGIIHIYDTKKLISSNKENNLIQKIIINKRSMIKYIYEFPDETLLCSTYSKIYRIKLTDNETSFKILGYIKLGKSELPTKLISLGNMFLLVLSEQRKLCNLKLFIKINFINSTQLNFNCKQDSFSDNDGDGINSNDYSNNIEIKNAFGKDMVEEDKEFMLCHKGKILNFDKILLCSIFEISKKNDNNENMATYEFITTSNYTYDKGDNRIEFYKVKKINDDLSVKRIKILNNISCSTEADSICQLNDKFLCIGLQNFDLKGQISGYAIVNIEEREISQIIKDNNIYSLNFIKENNLLMAAMEVRNKDNNYNMIKMYNITENEERIIKFENICQFKSKHNGIIVSIKSLGFTNNPINDDFKNGKSIICVTASDDKSVRIVQTKYY